MDFLQTIGDSDLRDNKAEKKFFKALKKSFKPNDTGIVYYRYPIKDKSGCEFDDEPDFVILHPDLGLLVVECKDYKIDDIEEIQGNTWITKKERSHPYTLVRDQGFFLKSLFRQDSNLIDKKGRDKITVNFMIALPNIKSREWKNRGLHKVPSSPKIIFEDDLTEKKLRKKLFSNYIPQEIHIKDYERARGILSGGDTLSDFEDMPDRVDNKRDLVFKTKKGIKKLDRYQEEIGFQIPPGPQQIRGVAGSGKTILLAMKAARMHLNNPDWDIVLTYSTRSLRETILESINRFYAKFSGGDKPNWDKLKLLIHWGGEEAGEGLYYNICQQINKDHINLTEARELCEEDEAPFEYCCNELLEEYELPEIYDAILIDEAQDFGSNFFNMCFEVLKKPKRLIWAYDEAQSLKSLEAPSPVNIFGTYENDELVVDLRGTYDGGIQKSHVMTRSYRSPRDILMAAHIFGMGLKRIGGPVQAITTKEGWENIGYKILEGDFRDIGETIKMTRYRNQSPHPLELIDSAGPFLKLKEFDEKEKEIEKVAELIREDVNEEKLDPEDILVIILEDYHKIREEEEKIEEENDIGEDEEVEISFKKKIEIGYELESKLNEYGIDVTFSWKGDRNIFNKKDHITVSGLHKAKGNQASQVYIMSFERVEKNSDKPLIRSRNEIFSALTRARIWCTITGVEENENVFDEMRSILESIKVNTRPIIEFPAPDAKELERELESEFRKTRLDEFDLV